MSELAVDLGEPMSYEDYLDLPDELRAEYVDGYALVNPPPSVDHQRICLELALLLRAAVRPPAQVVMAAGWRLPGGQRVRIPDVMVLRRSPTSGGRPPGTPETALTHELLVTETPLLVVEVLSSNRRDDLVRKSTAYLEAGLDQYWIIDPRDRGMDVFAREPTGWEPLLSLTERRPRGTVALPGGGEVTIDLTRLLG